MEYQHGQESAMYGSMLLLSPCVISFQSGPSLRAIPVMPSERIGYLHISSINYRSNTSAVVLHYINNAFADHKCFLQLHPLRLISSDGRQSCLAKGQS
jgi:hypothetical protein